jgi:MOSC domain-containing protein YiiM
MKVLEIFIYPKKGAPARPVLEAQALAGRGLEGDRYERGEGSWSMGEIGRRQITFIDAALVGACFMLPEETRRNVVTAGVDINWLVDNPGKKFRIGTAVFASVKYCKPCPIPSDLAGLGFNFKEVADRHRAGGLIAEVIETGTFRTEDEVILLD